MPKLSHSPPKYRKKTVKGYCYGVVTIAGREHYLGQYGSRASKLEYD